MHSLGECAPCRGWRQREHWCTLVGSAPQRFAPEVCVHEPSWNPQQSSVPERLVAIEPFWETLCRRGFFLGGTTLAPP